jgi:glycosyltransferase involved in cell wall biosynthesis
MTPALREPRILFLSHLYPPVFGGGGRFLFNLRSGLAELGIDSEVVCGNRGMTTGSDPGIHRLPTPGGEGLPRLGAYSFALFTPMALFALRRRYDIIHTMGNSHSVYAAILVSRILGKKLVIASIQNRQDDPGGISRERFGRIKNALFSRADRFICLNTLQLKAYREASYPEEKLRFIRNGIECARFSPCRSREEKLSLRQSLGLPAEAFVVVSIGAIIARKGMDLLAAAWREFRSQGGDGLLVLVGPNGASDPGSGVDDAFVDGIKQSLAAGGAGDSVRFTGQVANVPDFLRAADAFALMSRGEGFPLALLEAMSSGLPFLMWDLPDYGGYDLQDQVQGFLLPPFDTSALAQRLALLAKQGEMGTRMGEEGHRLASRYDVSQTTREHLQMYRELLGS